jgi:hypothetical protein
MQNQRFNILKNFPTLKVNNTNGVELDIVSSIGDMSPSSIELSTTLRRLESFTVQIMNVNSSNSET